MIRILVSVFIVSSALALPAVASDCAPVATNGSGSLELRYSAEAPKPFLVLAEKASNKAVSRIRLDSMGDDSQRLEALEKDLAWQFFDRHANRGNRGFRGEIGSHRFTVVNDSPN